MRISKQAEGRFLVKVNLGNKSFIGKTDSPQAAWDRAQKFMQDDFKTISISKIEEKEK